MYNDIGNVDVDGFRIDTVKYFGEAFVDSIPLDPAGDRLAGSYTGTAEQPELDFIQDAIKFPDLVHSFKPVVVADTGAAATEPFMAAIGKHRFWDRDRATLMPA